MKHFAIIGFFLTILCAFPVAAQEDEWGRQRTTMERMSLERLEAVHEDVQALADSYREAPLPHGIALTDYRGLFHVHADDSDHTGGTRPELLADAQKAGVEVIFLSDHYYPPTEDFMDNWRGVRDGVLFIPGAELTRGKGYLLHPESSIADVLDYETGDLEGRQRLIERTTEGAGLMFLSHVEERVDHPLDGLTGMEIYNRHADAKDDQMFLFWLFQQATNPGGVAHLEEALATYPHEVYAAGCDYLELYMDKWDESLEDRRVVGVGANDCHHNQVIVVKKVDDETALLGTIVDDDEDMRTVTTDQAAALGELLAEVEPGEAAVTLDFDPYHVSMRNVNTHIFAAEQTESAMRDALSKGHVYVAHEWLSDAKGFFFWAEHGGELAGMMGDTLAYQDGMTLAAQFPQTCHIRLIRDGEVVAITEGDTFSQAVTEPGVYRIEGWLDADDERRIWLYSNPIYIRAE